VGLQECLSSQARVVSDDIGVGVGPGGGLEIDEGRFARVAELEWHTAVIAEDIRGLLRSDARAGPTRRCPRRMDTAYRGCAFRNAVKGGEHG
jgi:hypothetical protein